MGIKPMTSFFGWQVTEAFNLRGLGVSGTLAAVAQNLIPASETNQRIVSLSVCILVHVDFVAHGAEKSGKKGLVRIRMRDQQRVLNC